MSNDVQHISSHLPQNVANENVLHFGHEKCHKVTPPSAVHDRTALNSLQFLPIISMIGFSLALFIAT